MRGFSKRFLEVDLIVFTQMKPKRIISTHKIENLVNTGQNDRVPITDLIAAMEDAGFGLALMIFSLGIIIPLPPPFPSVIAIPLVIFSWQMANGFKAPKLPKKFAKLTLKRSVLATLVQKSAPYIAKVEAILRPRLIFMTSPRVERALGWLILIFSSFIVLPIPLSNFIPGLGILIISFGLLGKDGLAIIFGIIIGLIGIVISILAIILGVEFFNYLKNILF